MTLCCRLWQVRFPKLPNRVGEAGAVIVSDNYSSDSTFIWCIIQPYFTGILKRDPPATAFRSTTQVAATTSHAQMTQLAQCPEHKASSQENHPMVGSSKHPHIHHSLTGKH